MQIKMGRRTEEDTISVLDLPKHKEKLEMFPQIYLYHQEANLSLSTNATAQKDMGHIGYHV